MGKHDPTNQPTNRLTVSVPVTCVSKTKECAQWIAHEGKQEHMLRQLRRQGKLFTECRGRLSFLSSKTDKPICSKVAWDSSAIQSIVSRTVTPHLNWQRIYSMHGNSPSLSLKKGYKLAYPTKWHGKSGQISLWISPKKACHVKSPPGGLAHWYRAMANTMCKTNTPREGYN